MNNHSAFLAIPFSLVLTIMTAGCATRNGAVYSHYQAFSLASFRISEEVAAPIQINVGYDRGSVASLPKRNGNMEGESTSLLSSSRLVANLALNATKSAPPSQFIVTEHIASGNAAVIAALPDSGTPVQLILDPSMSPVVFNVKGTQAERVAGVLGKESPLKKDQIRSGSLLREIRGKENYGSLLESTATTISGDFEKMYNEEKQRLQNNNPTLSGDQIADLAFTTTVEKIEGLKVETLRTRINAALELGLSGGQK